MNGSIIFLLIFLCFAFQFVHCGKSKDKKGLWEVDSDDDEPNDSTKTEKQSFAHRTRLNMNWWKKL